MKKARVLGYRPWATRFLLELERMEPGLKLAKRAVVPWRPPLWWQNAVARLASGLIVKSAFRGNESDAALLGLILGQKCAYMRVLKEHADSVAKLTGLVVPMDFEFKKLQTIRGRAEEAAANASGAEEREFLNGFVKGLCNVTFPGKEWGDTSTPVYYLLVMNGPKVETLSSVSELRAFLIQSGLSEQTLGDPKRLEKICERIGLRFRGRGRPRKNKTDN